MARATPSLSELFQSRSARAVDAGDDGRILVESDLTGTFQLFERDAGSGELRQLTDFAEPVSGLYIPGSRRAVLAMDNGGDERHQLYTFDLDDPPVADRERLDPIASDPRYVHELDRVSRAGDRLAFVSNRRNGVDFDVYVYDFASRESRCLYDGGGWCQPSGGFSPSGHWLATCRPGPRPLDDDLLVIDTGTGEWRVITPHPEEAALLGPPAWVGDGAFFFSSNVGRDHAAIFRHELSTGETALAIAEDLDLGVWSSGDGSTLFVVANKGGACRADVVDAVTLETLGEVPLPERGVIAFSLACRDPLLSDDGTTVTYTFSGPRIAGDVWSYDRHDGALTRLTTSPGVAPEQLVVPETHEVRSFDGERVPIFLYRPRPAPAPTPVAPAATDESDRSPSTAAGGAADPDGGPPAPPVVVLVHGGPEGQSVLQFSPVVQALSASGYAVVVPNVRGSVGYGKRYASLDDTTRRLDSVADMAAVHAWLGPAGLDAGCAALWGGSYGGYMVLAGAAFQPDLWAAGVDIVGISDLVTFLENTADYRRVHREHEYGSLAGDREFLERASPLRSVDAIRAPLFVIHGANDPRVPLGEAEQLVASLRRRGVRCELLVYPDEGHGLGKLVNRLDAYPRAIQFLDDVLGATGR